MKMLFGGDFQSQVYKKGGMLNPHERYVLELEGLTGVRKEAIESYIDENKLSDNDVLNIVIGLGRKQLRGSDFSSAVVGKKGNAYSKEIISFAKANKGMKLEFGGDFQAEVYDGGGSLHEHSIVAYKDGLRATYFVNKQGAGYKIIRHTGSVQMPFGSKQENDWKKWFINNVDTFEIIYAEGGYFDGTIPNASSYMTTYAQGGSLKAHGIEVGDTFIKTISGAIQKVRDKDGKIVYIDLSTGKRDSQPPLPFEDGGGIGMEEDIDLTDDNVMRVRKPAMPNRKVSKMELAEKYNSDAYEFMTEDKKAFGGGLFSRAKMMPKSKKYPNLEDKNVTLKNGKFVKVFSQADNKLQVMEFGKIGSGAPLMTVDISEVETIYNNGGSLEDKDTWQNLLEQYGFKKGRSKYGLDMYYKRGYTASVDKNLKNVDLMFEDDVLYKGYSVQGLLDALENQFGNRKMATGGALVGNQKRIDMNKNGKIDAEDFKLLRSSMNGAWRNDHKHVNHDEDYEVRYARPRPDRKGYKGKRKFGEGGGISNFERLSMVVAKNYEGKRVKPQYQKDYGKTYSKSEAKQVGNRVAGKMKIMKKAESGIMVAKANRGGVMVLAKKIRKEGESWKDALKRAGQQLK